MQLIAYNGSNDNLFRGAIMQSGFPIPLRDFSSGQDVYDLVVQGAGCTESEDTLECLRVVSLEVLQKAVDATPNIFGYQVSTRL
jgi:acetylcholinesterase